MTCNLELTYDPDDRSTVPEDYSVVITDDQIGCNLWLQSARDCWRGQNVLHIGVGNSSVYRLFADMDTVVDGISIAEREIEEAERLKEELEKPYCVFNFNKYDKKNWDKWPNKYKVIVDNNLKQHACCEDHWKDYYRAMIDLLEPGGFIVTHEQGFGSHKNKTTSLSIQELKDLAPDCEVYVIKSIGDTWHPVTVWKKP